MLLQRNGLLISPLIRKAFSTRSNRRLGEKFFITTLAPGHSTKTTKGYEEKFQSQNQSHASPATPQAQIRPLSPHLSIYQPQLTWLMSIGHRMTGAGLAAAVYAFGMTNGVVHDVSLTNILVELVASVPQPLVIAGKFVVAAPFMFHLLNGIRHLVWDLGWALTLRGVYGTGWLVNVGTLLSASALAFY